MSTLWVYARIQLMMFVFGIVGPIFLIGYFASQPDPELRWMYWWGLFITFGDILIALAITESVVRKDAEIAEVRARRRLGYDD
ncbi:hypothetical protein [Mycolicibacterium iranicum]|uniref:Uncharacterized protein n=1 Tax=Mycolicibacterium iranicum TaxID=912594 RepID=A0A1X1WEN3_MYCIR|nr:hypothetical protein [Mycolicibacterium iranicum]MCZ0731453.1 hypothetical protein [Mycolicibacterium iranicum]ORV85039.1 hypothetical protein AWC12_21320 [Mycolicibacterium iranicum]